MAPKVPVMGREMPTQLQSKEMRPQTSGTQCRSGQTQEQDRQEQDKPPPTPTPKGGVRPRTG